MKTLYFVYTTPQFYQQLFCPVMEDTFGRDPDVTVRFTMDNGILLDTLDNNVVPTASVKQRLYQLLSNCALAGAECIVVGCTAVNTATKELSALLNIPVISVDEPMIQKILAAGHKRVAVLSHTPINAFTIQRRLLAECPDMTVDLYPVEGAAEAFQANDLPAFRALMRDAALRIPNQYDAIALGHISSENVDFTGVAMPIYKTGECCIEAVRDLLSK